MSTMDTIKWIKPNGVIIITNNVEANIKMAKSLGWVEHKEEVSEKPKRKRRTKKAVDNGDS